MRAIWTFVGAAVVTACAAEKQSETTADTAAATSAAPAAATASADPDRAATGGSGIPAGYVGRTDRATQNLADAKYVMSGTRWEVTTGPAHIVYATKDTASGSYRATATFEQLEAPAHPEAYGLILGGQNLDQPSQRYAYFIVRGTGEYAVKVRDGAEARDVIAFTANDAVPKADASGKGSYKLTAQVGTDSVRFLVNDKPVGAAAKSAIPTDGVVGVRINHNLHVMVDPVTVTQ